MDNKVKVCIGIIIIILVIVICANVFKKDEDTTNSENITNTSNISEENKIANNTVENEVANEIENTNVVENQKLETVDLSNTVYESNSDVGTTDKKQEAIDLVKNQWGEDDTVTFSCDSITSDGIYIIAVTSKERAEVLSYFRVDLTAKTVTIDY